MGDIASGAAGLQRDEVDLRDVISEAYAIAREECAHGHQLVLTMVPGAVWILGEFSRLQAAVGSLLESACEHTAPGGRIKLSLERTDDCAIIRVNHGGVGLTGVAEKQRLNGAKRCVELHGGTLETRSGSARKGRQRRSEFTMCLPLATSGEPPA